MIVSVFLDRLIFTIKIEQQNERSPKFCKKTSSLVEEGERR